MVLLVVLVAGVVRGGQGRSGVQDIRTDLVAEFPAALESTKSSSKRMIWTGNCGGQAQARES